MSQGKPFYREAYVKPSTFEDGKPCHVYCDADDPDATHMTIEVGRYNEIRFNRHTFTGHNERGQYQKEGEWPSEIDRIRRMLQEAFDQGVNHQRKVTRDLFQKVMGI